VTSLGVAVIPARKTHTMPRPSLGMNLSGLSHAKGRTHQTVFDTVMERSSKADA
jgi:hypothetical protein